jgi:hypothetical protein
MPSKQHMSWSILFLIGLHVACIVIFVYAKLQTPPFPSTLVINLDERKDKWQQIQQEFKDWPVPIERLSAVKYMPGWKGCTLSHRKSIEIAKQRNYPWVLVVEDDCMLTRGAVEQFYLLLPFLWRHSERWDVFSGGLTTVSDSHVISQNPQIFRTKGYTTHFCLIHKGAYNKILNHMPKDPEKMTKAIDTWYHDHIRIWTTVPFLAVQRPSKSDIQDKEEDYLHMFKDAETKLRKLL